MEDRTVSSRKTSQAHFSPTAAFGSTREIGNIPVAAPPTNFFSQIRRRERDVHKPGVTMNSYFTPTLVSICAKVVAADFPNQPSIEHVPAILQQLIVAELSPELPITVTVPRIPHDDYWRLCYKERWLSGLDADAKEAIKQDNWKRVFLERNLEEILTSIDFETPPEGLLKELETVCVLCSPWIHKLRVQRMHYHVNINELLLWLRKLTDLQVTFGSVTCGMNFEFKQVGLQPQDCMHVADMLRNNSVLTRLCLPENHIDDDKLKGIITGLVKNVTLTDLDLSRNSISDGGAKVLAMLLVRKKQSLRVVSLADNNIRTEGARALGKALTMNSTLISLNLGLNRVEEGGKYVLECLRENSSLTSLSLSTNEMGVDCAKALCEVLKVNASLVRVDVSGNSFHDDIAKDLHDALECNSALRELDIRLCGIRDEQRYVLNDTLKKRPPKPPEGEGTLTPPPPPPPTGSGSLLLSPQPMTTTTTMTMTMTLNVSVKSTSTTSTSILGKLGRPAK